MLASKLVLLTTVLIGLASAYLLAPHLHNRSAVKQAGRLAQGGARLLRRTMIGAAARMESPLAWLATALGLLAVFVCAWPLFWSVSVSGSAWIDRLVSWWVSNFLLTFVISLAFACLIVNRSSIRPEGDASRVSPIAKAIAVGALTCILFLATPALFSLAGAFSVGGLASLLPLACAKAMSKCSKAVVAESRYYAARLGYTILIASGAQVLGALGLMLLALGVVIQAILIIVM